VVVAWPRSASSRPASRDAGPKRLNPISGAKTSSPERRVRAFKSVSKVGIVGAITFAFVAPKVTQLGAMSASPRASWPPA